MFNDIMHSKSIFFKIIKLNFINSYEMKSLEPKILETDIHIKMYFQY